MKNFKKLGIALGISAAFALPGHADELSDLKAQMNQILQQMDKLQQQQDATASKQVASEAKQAAAPAPVTAGALPGSFLVPGTSTSVKVGGYAYLSLIREMKGFLGNSQGVLAPFSNAAGGIPFDGSPAARQSGDTQMQARESRINIATLTPTPYGDLRTLVEGDFYGTGGSKLSTNGAALRLRHAMAEVGPWLVGQYWSNSADLFQGPDLYDFGGPVGLAGLNRLPQIRYTWKTSPKATLSASIEQPVQDFSGADGVAFQGGYSNISMNSINKTPDLTARYSFGDNWGRQSVGVIARRLTATNVGGAAGAILGDTTVSANGFSLNNQGTFNVFGKDKLAYQLVWENGAGRYITQIQPSAVLYPNLVGANNSLKTITSVGLNVSYLHFWNDKLRSTLDVGRVNIDIPHPEMPVTTMNSVTSIYANLIWTPVPKAEVGLEYAWAKINNEVPNSGIGSRLMLVGKYTF